jgi:hypothetical protein
VYLEPARRGLHDGAARGRARHATSMAKVIVMNWLARVIVLGHQVADRRLLKLGHRSQRPLVGR